MDEAFKAVIKLKNLVQNIQRTFDQNPNGFGDLVRIRGSPGETSPCTLMTPGACKIRRGCNVLQVPIQIKLLEVPKCGCHPLLSGSKL